MTCRYDPSFEIRLSVSKYPGASESAAICDANVDCCAGRGAATTRVAARARPTASARRLAGTRIIGQRALYDQNRAETTTPAALRVTTGTRSTVRRGRGAVNRVVRRARSIARPIAAP